MIKLVATKVRFRFVLSLLPVFKSHLSALFAYTFSLSLSLLLTRVTTTLSLLLSSSTHMQKKQAEEAEKRAAAAASSGKEGPQKSAGEIRLAKGENFLSSVLLTLSLSDFL